ncbi:atypical/PIKK/PI4K protein kinase [Auriscalpium vulgare]|uniref:Atypical/PIKK/PI4K protein kinase n=1 Tax=Auriscalpium vulgare TaxID=40419 RepID=A0ACB8RQR4_9AGAM|nr:atypical/PIKK/PI4K protein kinase [Auriscalpium vulgare]
MDALELNIHQLVLSDLAASIGASPHDSSDATVEASIDVITSKVTTRAVDDTQGVNGDAKSVIEQRVFMPASRVRCNIGFAELAINFPDTLVSSAVPVLLDILRDIPYIEFDPNLTWDDWSLPDQLVHSTVSALLKLAHVHSDYRKVILTAISTFTSILIKALQSGSPVEVLTHHALSFHGLYRAVISTHFPWQYHEWAALADDLHVLFSPDLIERLNRLLVDVLQSEEDPDVTHYIQTLVSRYVARGRPLNGYFLVCCVIEAQWTVLAQALYPSEVPSTPDKIEEPEAAAANKAWSALTWQAVPDPSCSDPKHHQSLKKLLDLSMQSFTDLLVQIEEMDSEPSLDTYAWETMSECLKLGTICTVAIGDVDSSLFSRLKVILSPESPIADSLVQVAALKAVTVLVQHFPENASSMAGHLRRFVTSPLPAFEHEFVSDTRAPAPLFSAAKCLSLCIKLAPGDDLIMSNMYSLLNYIAATSKEVHEALNAANSHLFSGSDRSTIHSVDTGLYGYTEDERRLIGISTISVVSRLALEFNQDDVTKLTIAMLVQRLRSVEPYAEAAIAHNLVDLALQAPEASFIDIIRAFSSLSLSANSDDPRFSNNMILAAQTRLAQELHHRPEFYDLYLNELLSLFGDKGVAIQNASVQSRPVKAEDMIEQLVSLLLPIDALLSHADYHPEMRASAELVSLFRNMWFLCTLFRFSVPDDKEVSATEWRRPALSRIAVKTPPLVSEAAHDSLMSDVEFNSSVRLDYAHNVLSKHRSLLATYLPHHAVEVRSLSPGLVIFLLAMHDVESMRSAAGFPASLLLYFTNSSLNNHPELLACMETLAEKVMKEAVHDLNLQAREQSLPAELLTDLQALLIGSTHRVAKARIVASKYMNRLITSFPSLMCDPSLVFAILEVLTLLRRAYDSEFVDEYNPVYEFHSERAGITLQLTDDYKVRDEILVNLQRNASNWFELTLSRAPGELQSTLQKYLSVNQSLTPIDSVDLGASVAEHFGKAVGPVERKLYSLTLMSKHKPDRAKILASQLASKGYFTGEIAGLRLASRNGHNLERPPSENDNMVELAALKTKMSATLREIREKKISLTIQDLKRLLFRCASVIIAVSKCEYALIYYLVALPFEVFTPSAIAAGIEVATWVISERPEFEVAMMTEINAAWMATIRHEKGIFSKALNYDDPFYHPVDYAPTDKDKIDRATSHARRVLSPHTLILQMWFSRLQAARYRRPGLMLLFQRMVLHSARAHRTMSTHPLAREARFSFLLFGFEALQSSRLDSFCEHVLRESLYVTAFSWFSVRSQWSHGANRVQMDADHRLLQEFLSVINLDTARLSHQISSLGPMQAASMNSTYVTRMKNMAVPLKLLLENEMYRLSVWANPINDLKRGPDYVPTVERTLLDSTWMSAIRTVWEIDPAIAVHFTERFKHPIVASEVGRSVRSNPKDVLHVPEALRFLLGSKLDLHVRRDLKYLFIWDPVPPIMAVTFFEPRYHNDSLILQYAHRVLAQHPVDLTFFFVPQIVQALRYDERGYVTHFILETAKISQLFCHQIIWNMKANCYKDDLAEVEDPMKPVLDRIMSQIIDALSGEAKDFYDREFGFFNEVTSISGKLKPFIKKTKPEKKAKIDEEMAKIIVDVGVYLPSNPDGKVIDIDKKSGRPLQSHAKAPFMATFKVRKELVVIDADPDSLITGDDGGEEHRTVRDVLVQAIFKVGDDCRQDVLALQLIAMFKNIFTGVGLTLYLYPYRVTATAPGCGVIDVVPNATSRDEMGRAKVNDLLDFFVAKYGGQDTVAFQKARLNFIQSMAAYSVACYILQIKDRHNGNIMIDGEGHIVHIDFGFLFDIGPGGVKFEPNSFKLNHEMVVLMGGRYSQGYALFQQLCVKAFLAIRPHAEQLISTVQLMLDTGLPSFKGEGTIRRLRDRYALPLTERQAADYMMGIVKNAHENVRSTAYDEFQRLQNGIPYK